MSAAESLERLIEQIVERKVREMLAKGVPAAPTSEARPVDEEAKKAARRVLRRRGVL